MKVDDVGPKNLKCIDSRAGERARTERKEPPLKVAVTTQFFFFFLRIFKDFHPSSSKLRTFKEFHSCYSKRHRSAFF